MSETDLPFDGPAESASASPASDASPAESAAAAAVAEPIVEPAEPARSLRPGCLLAAIAGAVGALVGALTAGLILAIVLGGDGGTPVPAGETGDSQTASTSAPASRDSGDDAASIDADEADASGAANDTASAANGVAVLPSVEVGASYLEQLLAGGYSGAGAPLGDRLAHINVKAVLDAVQEAVVIVDVTSDDGGDGGGSGFIVDADGLIVTNAHVVEGAESIEVRFFGGERTRAEAIAVDSTRDLAVLQVEVGNLPTVPLGSSAGVEVGDEVIAIGNAIGIVGEPTVTAGIVSGLNRTIPLEDNKRLVRLIQTDAAINPGNSGGPLVNAAGEVIGINTAIAGGFVEGIGYAVSIDHALPVIDQLLEGIVQARAFFGVSLVSVDTLAEWQSAQGFPDLEDLGDTRPETVEPGQDMTDAPEILLPPGVTSGAVVVIVVEGEAADRAGIVVGDVIIAFNGARIDTSLDLVTEVLALVPGDPAEVTLIGPDGSQRVIEVTLGSFPTGDE